MGCAILTLIIFSGGLSIIFLVTGIVQESKRESRDHKQRAKEWQINDDNLLVAFVFSILSCVLQLVYGPLALAGAKNFGLTSKLGEPRFRTWMAVYGLSLLCSFIAFAIANENEVGHPSPEYFPVSERLAFTYTAALHWMFTVGLLLIGVEFKLGTKVTFTWECWCEPRKTKVTDDPSLHSLVDAGSEINNSHAHNLTIENINKPQASDRQGQEENPLTQKCKSCPKCCPKCCNCCYKFWLGKPPRNPHALEHVIICYYLMFGLTVLALASMGLNIFLEYCNLLHYEYPTSLKKLREDAAASEVVLKREGRKGGSFALGILAGLLQTGYSILVIVLQVATLIKNGWPDWIIFIPLHVLSFILSLFAFLLYHEDCENLFRSYSYFDDRELLFPAILWLNLFFLPIALLLFIAALLSRRWEDIKARIRGKSSNSRNSEVTPSPSAHSKNENEGTNNGQEGGQKLGDKNMKENRGCGRLKSWLLICRDDPWPTRVRLFLSVTLVLVTTMLLLVYFCIALIPSQYETDALTVHNALRARHVNTPPVLLSRRLNAAAQRCARWYHDTQTLNHECPAKWASGENLGGGSAEESCVSDEVKAGFSGGMSHSFWTEIEYFRWPVTQTHFPEAGHFTQLVWKEVTEIGVGIEYGPHGRKAVLLYYPSGNVVPVSYFKKNVFPLQETWKRCYKWGPGNDTCPLNSYELALGTETIWRNQPFEPT